MSRATIESINEVLDNIFCTTSQAARKGCSVIGAMSWRRLVLVCVGIALLLSIIPFVVTLVITFGIVKLVVGAIADQSRRQREAEEQRSAVG